MRPRKLLKVVLLVLGTTLVSLLVASFALRRYVGRVGAGFEHAYLCEPRPKMWRPDPVLGYANAPHFRRRAFANVVGRTDGAGFRSDHEVAATPEEGAFRIVGLGDSITWGECVNREDTFLGVLEGLLSAVRDRVEVVNAGVVGYSTYQERLMLEARILPYRPDVVIVTYCTNDLLPTEDPFGLARHVYSRYLARLRSGGGPVPLNERELSTLDELSSLLSTAPNVWSAVRRSDLDPDVLVKLLIGIPMMEMVEIAETNGFRILFVFLPGTVPTERQRQDRAELLSLLQRIGGECLDLSGDLVQERPAEPAASSLRSLLAWHARSGLRAFLVRTSLEEWDPLLNLRRLGRYKAFRRRQTETCFIDDLGHPSEKGHRIIAQRIFERL